MVKPAASPLPKQPVAHIPFKQKKKRSVLYGSNLIAASREAAAIELLHIKAEECEHLNSTAAAIRRLREAEGYAIHTPLFPCYLTHKLASIKCQACDQLFRGLGSTLYKEPAYFVHCIGECMAYQASGLIGRCDDCKLLFLNQEYLDVHNKTFHPNPVVILRKKFVSSRNI